MSAVVTTIFDAIKTQAQTTLGASYTYLKHVYDPAQNDHRTIAAAFGVRHLSASQIPGVTRVYTMEHGFELLVLKRAVRRDSDVSVQTVIGEVYDKIDDLFRAMVNTKLGIANPNPVLDVTELQISEPELLSNEAALIRASFNVKYRQALS